MTLAERFRRHAGYCDSVAAPLYGVLLRAFADDWDAGGPVRRVCTGWEQTPTGAVVQLRLLAGLHRLVLTGAAPELAPFYPSLGGTAAPEGVWPIARAVLAAHTGALRTALEVVPQTNETGRSAALAVGLLVASARHGLDRVRLLEVGASGGLNLLVDRYRIEGEGWAWGPQGSPVLLAGAVRGRLPTPVAPLVVDRRGCDLAPVDVRSEHGRLQLTSFVWPDHVQRYRRLLGALQLAAADPPAVDRARAGAWLAGRLAAPAEPGVLTVVWHSIFWQYLDDAERAAVQAAVDGARTRMPLAHVMLESTSAPYVSHPQVVLDGEVLGSAPAHGVPVQLQLPR